MIDLNEITHKQLSATAQSRLLALVNFMEALPPIADKHFHMRYWFSTPVKPGFSGAITRKKKYLSCNTTACAAGWACMVPELKKLGLRLVVANAENIYSKHMLGQLELKGAPDIDDPMEILAKVFDITFDQANYLFNGNLEQSIHTPKDWAVLCRNFLQRMS